VLNFPSLILTITFVALWVSEVIGASFRKRWKVKEEELEDFRLIVTATLTLLGLIIGFTFSMATTRYDERKNYEEAEANAIGTEYARSDLLPALDAARVRVLLKNYLEQRVLFYNTQDDHELRNIGAATAQLETDLWSAVQVPAVAQPSPVIALAVSGMNDVLDSKDRTQGAWWNRIPGTAWGLMGAIAICGNLLIGYGLRSPDTKAVLLLVLPLVVSISFFLIADIDSPHRGIIRVRPDNLTSLSQSLHVR
jgi:hypothetical protein